MTHTIETRRKPAIEQKNERKKGKKWTKNATKANRTECIGEKNKMCHLHVSAMVKYR